MGTARRHKEKVAWRDVHALGSVIENPCSAGHDVHFIARVRRLGVNAFRCIQLDRKRSMGKQLSEYSAIRCRYARNGGCE